MNPRIALSWIFLSFPPLIQCKLRIVRTPFTHTSSFYNVPKPTRGIFPPLRYFNQRESSAIACAEWTWRQKEPAVHDKSKHVTRKPRFIRAESHSTVRFLSLRVSWTSKRWCFPGFPTRHPLCPGSSTSSSCHKSWRRTRGRATTRRELHDRHVSECTVRVSECKP